MNATQPLAGFKILVVMPSIPLYGLELANIEIMRLLQDKGADILFAVNRDHGQRVIKALDRAGLVYAKVGFAAPWSLPRSWQAWRTLRKNLQEISHDMQVVVRKFGPDCIFMTGLSYLLYSIPWLMRIRCRVIFNVPNPPDLAARPRRKRWLQNLLWRRAAAPFTRVFVANSDFTRNAIAAVGIRAGKIQRIYLSVPQRNDSDSSKIVRLVGEFNIVFAGQIKPHKGVVPLLEAARRIVNEYPGVNFYLAGDLDPDDAFMRELQSTLIRDGLAERIVQLGRVDDIPGLFQQGQLHVCPSLIDESFGLTVLEAKQAGIPSLVFPSGGLQETVQHGETGYICQEKTTEAFYEGLKYYLDDRQCCREQGKAAQHSLAGFSESVIADEWVALLQREYRL